MNAFFSPSSHSTIVKASGCATKSVADRLQTPVVEAAQRQSILCNRAGSDANGAFTNAYLFICSPHSCEVVKPVFSRSFGGANLNLKKGCTMTAPADHRMHPEVLASERFERIEPLFTDQHAICAHMTCVGGSLWALRRR